MSGVLAHGLVALMEARLTGILADLETLVSCESPSVDKAAVARSAGVVSRVGSTHLGADPEHIVIDGWTHLRWRLGRGGPGRILLLGHHDTVWPLGSLAAHPYTAAGGVIRGPGCLDMKAGLVMIFHAMSVLGSADGGVDGVTVLVTGDEELGSPSSRSLIEAEAAGCAAALVLEAAADGGALKTERKGVSQYELRVHGRAAHAGLEPERGVNAAVEIAHQLLTVAALADPAAGTTVTPTLLSAGTTANTVPATASLAVDVRVRTAAQQAQVERDMRALRPVVPRARLEVAGGANRPPLPATASAALYERAAGLAAGLGFPAPPSAAVGGASDGNYTAGVGIPTLDGLGAVGGGAHADDEYVLVAELPRRTALLAALVRALRGQQCAATNPAPASVSEQP